MPEMTKQEFAARLLFWLLPWPISKALPRAVRIYYWGPTGAPPSGWYDYWGEPYPGPIDPDNPPDPGDLPDIPAGPDNLFNPYVPNPGESVPSHPSYHIGPLTEVTIACGRLTHSNTRLYSRGSADSTWLEARNSPEEINAVTWTYYFNEMIGHEYKLPDKWWRLNRTFFMFDLTGLPTGKTVHSVSLLVRGKQNASLKASVQESLQVDLDTSPEWTDFTGYSFAQTAWVVNADNTFVFNSAGCSYIQSVIGAFARLVVRDYDYDYKSVSPTQEPQFSGCYSTWQTTGLRPRLVINYW